MVQGRLPPLFKVLSMTSGGLAFAFLLLSVGCSSPQSISSNAWKRIETRQSFLRWNCKSAMGCMPTSDTPRVVQLASLSPSQLNRLLECCPPPDRNELCGQWVGINKGFGPAIVGITQDVKQFKQNGTIGDGNNVLVDQVPIDDLTCRGWQPKIDRLTGSDKEMGNFAVCSGKSLELNYSLARNPFWDPSRFLVDEIVQVEDGLLLGRANFQVGYVRIPIAYFTLSRRPCNGCDVVDCDSLQ